MHEPHLAARPLRRVPADGRSHRHLEAHRLRQGARAPARGDRGDEAAAGRAHRAHGRRGADEEAAQADVGYLVRLWGEIAKKREGAHARRRCSRASSISCSRPRAISSPTTSTRSSSTTSSSTSASCRFVEMFMPERVKDVELYDGRRADLRRVRHRGRDRARALAQGPAAVRRLPDHRSGRGAHRDRRQHGRFVGKGSKDMEETILKTNLEAVERDRLPAPLPQHRRAHHPRPHRHGAAQATARRCAARSRSCSRRTRRRRRSTASRELGLIEMTRKRTRESLGRTAARAVLLLRRHRPAPVEGDDRLRDPARDPAQARRPARLHRSSSTRTPRSPTCSTAPRRPRVDGRREPLHAQDHRRAAQGVPPRAVRSSGQVDVGSATMTDEQARRTSASRSTRSSSRSTRSSRSTSRTSRARASFITRADAARRSARR